MEYNTVYKLLKDKKAFGIYDEDRLTITTINNQQYVVNLNCLMFYQQVLVDDNDTIITFEELTQESINTILHYMVNKLNQQLNQQYYKSIMKPIFKLPNSILREKDNSYITHHYHYYSGKQINESCFQYEITISHIKADGQCYLLVYIEDKVNNTGKEFKIRSINNSSIIKLQERIDNYLNKLGVTTQFYNYIQKLIDDEKQYLENEYVIEINENEVITKSGNKHTLYPWQENKTIEEINNILIEDYNKSVHSYEKSLKEEE